MDGLLQKGHSYEDQCLIVIVDLMLKDLGAGLEADGMVWESMRILMVRLLGFNQNLLSLADFSLLL